MARDPKRYAVMVDAVVPCYGVFGGRAGRLLELPMTDQSEVGSIDAARRWRRIHEGVIAALAQGGFAPSAGHDCVIGGGPLMHHLFVRFIGRLKLR